MSKVKIQGNASGTGVVTLTAPNTNTDRTITLPDDTQTLIGTNASGNVGIGTGSPSEKLEVYGGSFKLLGTNGAGVRITEGSSENGGEINLLNTTGAVRGLIDYVDADDDGEGAMRFLNLSSTGNMEIGTNGAEVRFRVGGTEKLRIQSGGITFNGDTAAANALDDYEEGTWTPTVGTTSGVTTASCSAVNCVYTKVGNLVTLSGYIYNIVWSDITDGTNVVVGGLPFSVISYASATLSHNNTNVTGLRSNPTDMILDTNSLYFNQASNNITGNKFMISLTVRVV